MSCSSDGSILERLETMDSYTNRLADLPLPTDRSGQMWKRGRGQHISFIRPWAVRHFVLDHESKKLSYSASEEVASPGDIKGSVILDANASVKPTPNANLPKGANFGFEILTASGNIELGVPDEECQKAWIRALQLCIQGDAISEAKIQKKIYDDHIQRRKERDERKEKEAEELMAKAMTNAGTQKLLKKESSLHSGNMEEVAPPEPSRESLEAEALLMGSVHNAKAMKHSASFRTDGNTTVTMEVDTSAAHMEIMDMTAKIKTKVGEEEERKAELVRVHQAMKQREQKVNELRRKHQVRQNFRAAVKRAIIQHKFITQMQDNATLTRTGDNRYEKKITKFDKTNILFEQGEKSDIGNSIEKMLAKKALEKQLQLKMMTPPPPSIIASYESRMSESEDAPPPPPRTESVRVKQEVVPPPPTAPRPPPPRVDSHLVGELFNALPPEVTDTSERLERLRGAMARGMSGNESSKSVGPPPGPPPDTPPADSVMGT
ncbi:hypothetical protein TeGR_g11989 [Tetraparma gracilis]|uniref:PH domain-containing protein n=1 Tax=Tetraparma gracilis TaxID=2962635 RepID=A0ABQ6M3I2_9STRA|nr:hypothetical protein TeGR_g11989 [Tetraparma gracilis]